MKTKELTGCALLCALYGLLLAINSAGALLVETYLPFLFALPVSVCVLMYGAKPALLAAAAMLLMTFMLGSVTTWVYAGSFVIAGWLCALAFISRRRALMIVLSFALLAAGTYVQMTVLAAFFGFDAAAEKQALAFVLSWISWNTLLWLISFFIALSQTLSLLCIDALCIARIPGIKQKLPAGEKRKDSKEGANFRWLPYVFILLAVPALLRLAKIATRPEWLLDLSLVLFAFAWYALAYFGFMHFLVSRKKKPSFIFTFLAVLAAFVPGINAGYVMEGFVTLIKKRSKV
jgi:hypothetical protein